MCDGLDINEWKCLVLHKTMHICYGSIILSKPSNQEQSEQFFLKQDVMSRTVSSRHQQEQVQAEGDVSVSFLPS